MAAQRSQNDAVFGQSFKVLTRNLSAYGRTWTFYDVLFVRGVHNTAFYQAAPFDRIRADLNNIGMSQLNVKYVVFADVLTNGTHTPTGTSCNGGQSEYNGNQGIQFRRCRDTTTGATFGFRWGCADHGDTDAMHEGLHEWGTVAPGSADYDSTPGHANHVVQSGDLMFWTAPTTLSGHNDGGGINPNGQTQWDIGAQSYTSRVLAFPSYLTSFPTSFPIHEC